MTHQHSTDETTIIAIYPSRQHAEIARDRLEDEDIYASIKSDDVGGMHPHLQQTQGVMLLVLGSQAQHARRALDQASLLPKPSSEAQQRPDVLLEQERRTYPWWFTVAFVLVALAIVIGILFGLMA